MRSVFTCFCKPPCERAGGHQAAAQSQAVGTASGKPFGRPSKKKMADQNAMLFLDPTMANSLWGCWFCVLRTSDRHCEYLAGGCGQRCMGSRELMGSSSFCILIGVAPKAARSTFKNHRWLVSWSGGHRHTTWCNASNCDPLQASPWTMHPM